MNEEEQVQEITESIAINAMNGGNLTGMVFRHSDAPQSAKKEMIVVKAGAPTKMLHGVKPYRMDVEITMQSPTDRRLAALHGVAMARLQDPQTLKAAKESAGIPYGHGNVDIYFEDMSGDRSETKSLRKRTITIPFEVKVGD